MKQESQRRVPLWGARSPERARTGLAVGAVVLAAAVLVPGARVWGARGRAGAPARVAASSSGVPDAVGHARSFGRGIREPAVGVVVPPPDDGSRGFSHRLHRGVACTSCHASGSSHGALKVRTREDCMACHHSPAQAAGCTTCHEVGKLPVAGRTVEVRTTVAPGASTRTLPFAHSFHAAVSCRDCHGVGLQERVAKDCTGCHEQHHAAARECQRCHRPQDVKGHSTSVHGGCGGGGCHSDPVVISLSWSRTVCTTCHQDRARHAAGRECATCHQVPALHKSKEVAR